MSYLKKAGDIALSPLHPHLSSTLLSMMTALLHLLTMQTPCSLELSSHQNPLLPVTFDASPTLLDNPPTTKEPAAPQCSACLAVLGTGAPTPNTTALLTTLLDSQIPQNYWEAMTRPDLWQPPMETEWAVLGERGVFELVDAPPDAHVINSMWVYANKYNTDSDIIKCKARLVAKGYTQIPGLDYDQTYASVV